MQARRRTFMPTMLVPQKKNGDTSSRTARIFAPSDSARPSVSASATPLTLASALARGIDRGSRGSSDTAPGKSVLLTMPSTPLDAGLVASVAVSVPAGSELLARAGPTLTPRRRLCLSDSMLPCEDALPADWHGLTPPFWRLHAGRRLQSCVANACLRHADQTASELRPAGWAERDRGRLRIRDASCEDGLWLAAVHGWGWAA